MSGSGSSTRRAERGYSLVALMAAVAIMLVLLAAAMPSWRYLVKNDREQELLFRGGEIADAIQRYQRRNGNALPASLDVLVKGKFLRRAYKDPMTRDGRWRFLRPGDTLGVPGSPTPGGLPGPFGTTTTTTTTTMRPSAVLAVDRDHGRLPGSGEHEHGKEPAHDERPHASTTSGCSCRASSESSAGRWEASAAPAYPLVRSVLASLAECPGPEAESIPCNPTWRHLHLRPEPQGFCGCPCVGSGGGGGCWPCGAGPNGEGENGEGENGDVGLGTGGNGDGGPPGRGPGG